MPEPGVYPDPGALFCQLLFVAMAALAWLSWLRARSTERLDIAAMLTSLAAPVLFGAALILDLGDSELLLTLWAISITLHPFLLLRLIWSFRPKRPWIHRIAMVGTAASVVVLATQPLPTSATLTVLMTLWFMALEALASGWLLVGGILSRGVSRWRMCLAGAGSVLLGIVIVLMGVLTLQPALEGLVHVAMILMSTAAGLAYFLGFMPPASLRRAWQDAELRRFLVQSQTASIHSRGEVMLENLGTVAEDCVGGLGSHLMMWDDEQGRFTCPCGQTWEAPAALRELWHLRQGRLLPLEAVGALAPEARSHGATCVLAVPIASAERRQGLVLVYLPAGSLFPDDDIQLLRLLGEQTVSALEQGTLHAEQRRLIEQLSQTNQKLQRASAAKNDFLAGISHELRTPLNSIIGFAELLEDEAAGPVSEEQHEFLGDILSSAGHLLELINDVLDISRIESGNLQLIPEALDVRAVVESACSAFSPLLSEKSLALDVEIAESLSVVNLDPVRLRQIIDNYVSNAVKFTPQGGQIQVRVEPEGDGWFRLSVRDTGIGISRTDHARLFKRFERLGAVDQSIAPGTGLGLALTRELVEAQQGSVGCESIPGEGSTFWARLPRKLEAS